jgi:pimeloyl-ACP methyl ester carboxylesterase
VSAPLVRRLAVNGAELEVVDEGSGDPVVFVHGGGSDASYWEPQRAAVVGAGYRFFAFSQRYRRGSTTDPGADDSASTHVADLRAVIASLDSDSVHLVGFSSAIALRTAVTAPGSILSLLGIEPAAPWLLEDDPDGSAILAAWRDANRRLRDATGDDVDHRARLWFELVNNRGAGTFDAQAEPFREMWLANFGRSGPPATPVPLGCADLGQVTTRTLILAAEHGLDYSRAMAERIVGCIPAAALEVLPGVTHFMSFQEPGMFNERLLRFLAG